ncbi:magnesium transporter, partial [bacterium]|nr:magnesium transporter [bacterium]
MINTLFIPELREMLSDQNLEELSGFCVALHPSRTAMFMEGLEDDEVWQVLKHTDSENTADIFSFFNRDRQLDLIGTDRKQQAADLILHLPSDDRVDLLQGVDDALRASLLDLLPVDHRRDILRLSQYPEGTAGAVMTTEMAMLLEDLTVREAIDEIGRQSENYETIYYLYIVDDEERLQ